MEPVVELGNIAEADDECETPRSPAQVDEAEPQPPAPEPEPEDARQQPAASALSRLTAQIERPAAAAAAAAAADDDDDDDELTAAPARSGSTPPGPADLYKAAGDGDISQLKQLLDGGAQPDLANVDRRTAIHLAG